MKLEEFKNVMCKDLIKKGWNAWNTVAPKEILYPYLIVCIVDGRVIVFNHGYNVDDKIRIDGHIYSIIWKRRSFYRSYCLNVEDSNIPRKITNAITELEL